jgi:hypothetical protein
MASLKGRIIKPETLFIDNVAIELEEGTDSIPWHGWLELPVGATLRVGETYRMELYDGRAGEIRIKAYDDISTKGEFVGVGKLV